MQCDSIPDLPDTVGQDACGVTLTVTDTDYVPVNADECNYELVRTLVCHRRVRRALAAHADADGGGQHPAGSARRASADDDRVRLCAARGQRDRDGLVSRRQAGDDGAPRGLDAR